MKQITKSEDVIKALGLTCTVEELENTELPEGFEEFLGVGKANNS